ncbi:MAG: F0F1 ATP synthase subunit beta, partial [Patescibacteria group bacterium]
MAVRSRVQSGAIVQIIGPVVDVRFEGALPDIHEALFVAKGGLALEVQQHLGSGVVRAVAMSSTEGLERGRSVGRTKAPISVPVGKPVLGRMFNVLGEPIDGKADPKAKTRWPIHRDSPDFTQQSTETEIFETGIK